MELTVPRDRHPLKPANQESTVPSNPHQSYPVQLHSTAPQQEWTSTQSATTAPTAPRDSQCRFPASVAPTVQVTPKIMTTPLAVLVVTLATTVCTLGITARLALKDMFALETLVNLGL